MKTILNYLVASVVLFISSCSKEKASSGITYQLKTSTSPSFVNGRVMQGVVQWTSGYASLAEIEFEAESNSTEIEYKSEIKQKFDLFAPLSTIGVINIPPGNYNDIEFEMEVQPNATDAALQLSGVFTNGSGTVTPVVFKLNAALEIEAEMSNITIALGDNFTALNTLNISLLTTGVTETMLNNATRNGGVIEISTTSNVNIYNIIFNNLKTCSGVEVDD